MAAGEPFCLRELPRPSPSLGPVCSFNVTGWAVFTPDHVFGVVDEPSGRREEKRKQVILLLRWIWKSGLVPLERQHIEMLISSLSPPAFRA